MEREAEYLLHLLGAFLRQEEPQCREDLDWEKLTALARIHNVSGILGYMAISWPICPEERRKANFRRVCMGTIAGFANRGALAEELSRTLEAEEIDHILMKGYILRGLYPVPELRTFGDIDLVIRPGDREKSHELMLRLGFTVKTDWEPVYSYGRGSEFYELHTQLLEVDVSEKADCRAYFSSPWDHVEPLGDHSFGFTPEYHFIYLLTHIAKHVTGSGAGIRMYLDVAAFLQHYGHSLDWAGVARELEKLGLSGFAAAALALVQEAFGISSPLQLEKPKENVTKEFLEFTLNGGIFGRNAQDSGTNALKNQSRDGREISRAGTLAGRLFPSAESIQSRYTYLQDKPWLLPVAWVHRIVKTRGSWQAHTEEARNILSADKEEVQRLTRLYRDIGL